MRWFKTVLEKDKGKESVMEFVPLRFDLATSNEALEYIKTKAHGTDFRMSDVVKVQTGVSEVELASQEEVIEAKALDKLKEIQEQAYKEAYALGLVEGRDKALHDHSIELKAKLEELGALVGNIRNMKTELLASNESHLIRLLFQMASRVALTHFAENQNGVVDILRNAVQLAQDEEHIAVSVAETQLQFLEELKKSGGREYEFMEKVKFQPDKTIKPGGCIVETNFGVVDSRIEQRVEQLWNSLKENMPIVKDKIGTTE